MKSLKWSPNGSYLELSTSKKPSTVETFCISSKNYVCSHVRKDLLNLMMKVVKQLKSQKSHIYLPKTTKYTIRHATV